MTYLVELVLAIALVLGLVLILRGVRPRQASCGKCGHRQPATAAFCGHCGAPLK